MEKRLHCPPSPWWASLSLFLTLLLALSLTSCTPPPIQCRPAVDLSPGLGLAEIRRLDGIDDIKVVWVACEQVF